MTPQATFSRVRLCLAGLLTLACLSAVGCIDMTTARLLADTALPDGAMSDLKKQSAYDGETVNFELECYSGAVHYVIFSVGDKETLVDVGDETGRYRWSHTFKAGPAPKEYVVHAVPYVIRDKRDYFFDKNENKWIFYPSRNDRPDFPLCRDRMTRITCYRVNIGVPFVARGGPPKRVELSLVKATGERKSIPPRVPGADDGKGFIVVGPDKKGRLEIRYAPTVDEVSRAGTTLAEAFIEHADGSTEQIKLDVPTP